jgi:pyruvate formate lyase activating enzyme
LHSLALLKEKNIATILRCPIVPGINDTDEYFAAIKKICHNHLNIIEAEIIPYHRTGDQKWNEIGLNYELLHLEAIIEEQKMILEEKIR